jgi:hypothetical protein
MSAITAGFSQRAFLCEWSVSLVVSSLENSVSFPLVITQSSGVKITMIKEKVTHITSDGIQIGNTVYKKDLYESMVSDAELLLAMYGQSGLFGRGLFGTLEILKREGKL